MSGVDQPEPVRIIHIGAFDLASYGDQIFPLVAAGELARRLGTVELLPFGPVGSTGTPGSGESTCWALGPWSEDRAAEIAGRASVVLCGGGEFVQGESTVYAPFYGISAPDARELRIDRWFLEVLGAAEASCPVVWHAPGVPADIDAETATRVREATARRAIVAVRDDRSRDRLVAAGVTAAVDVVPDTAFVLPRVLSPERLAEHRDRLRADGRFPADGPVLVIQGNRVMDELAAPLARTLAQEIPEARVVLVSVSPCHADGEFADAMAAAHPGRTWRVPDDAPVEAIAAAISGADCYVGVSLHGAITAHAYGRPHVTLDPFHHAKLEGFADLVDGRQWLVDDVGAAVTAVRSRIADASSVVPRAGIAARIDAHFDRIAALCEERADARLAPVDWSDTPATLHLSLRRVPRHVDPVPAEHVDGIRRPDIQPTATELQATVDAALSARAAQDAASWDDEAEKAALRNQNRELQGAVDHLLGVREALEAEVGRLRGSPVSRVLQRLRPAGDTARPR